MANKYCDHGLYGAAVVVGSTSGSSTTLTVASVTSGTLGLGAMISGTGIAANTYISALGTGTGTTGTYTMSQANNISAGTTITASYGGPSLIPAWGVAQEGDGTGTGAATPATISVDINSWTFTSGSSTFSVMGCTALTISGSANSATNAQYSATKATMAANIAAAINLATATTVNIPSGWVATQVRNTVYAKATGTVIELMTRAGSASWNTLVALSWTNVTGSSSQSWGSGAGGAWGYLFNTITTIWPSAVAAANYGLWAATLPFAGSLSAGDIVNIRSNKTVLCMYNLTPTMAAMGTSTSFVRFVIDNSVIWADGSNPVLTLVAALSSSGSVILSASATAYASIEATYDHTSGHYGLHLLSANPGTGGWILAFSNRPMTGVKITLASTTGAIPFSSFASAPTRAEFRGFLVVLNSATALTQYVGSSYSGTIRLVDGIVDQGSYASSHTGLFAMGLSTSVMEWVIDGLKFTNFVIGSMLFASHGTSKRYTFKNCTFGNVTNYGAKLCQVASPVFDITQESCAISDIKSGNSMLLDQRLGFAEWNSARSYPTLNATLVSGNKFSVRAHPTTVSGVIAPQVPYRLPVFMKINELVDGARQFTVEVAIKSSLSLTKKTIWAEISYVDVNNTLVTLSTYDEADGALTASTSSWSQESGGQVTYDDSGVMYFDKYKLQVSTPTGKNLKNGVAISCTVALGYTASSVTDMVFVDPDIGIA